jgi:Filamentous haemagglutinin family outer membrane protein
MNGNTTLSQTVPSSGSDVATLNPIPQVPVGNSDLIAPLGTIDVGEAGVRVSVNPRCRSSTPPTSRSRERRRHSDGAGAEYHRSAVGFQRGRGRAANPAADADRPWRKADVDNKKPACLRS